MILSKDNEWIGSFETLIFNCNRGITFLLSLITRDVIDFVVNVSFLK